MGIATADCEKKTDLMSVHSVALVATFVYNLVYTYKCDTYVEIIILEVSYKFIWTISFKVIENVQDNKIGASMYFIFFSLHSFLKRSLPGRSIPSS